MREKDQCQRSAIVLPFGEDETRVSLEVCAFAFSKILCSKKSVHYQEKRAARRKVVEGTNRYVRKFTKLWPEALGGSIKYVPRHRNIIYARLNNSKEVTKTKHVDLPRVVLVKFIPRCVLSLKFSFGCDYIFAMRRGSKTSFVNRFISGRLFQTDVLDLCMLYMLYIKDAFNIYLCIHHTNNVYLFIIHFRH